MHSVLWSLRAPSIHDPKACPWSLIDGLALFDVDISALDIWHCRKVWQVFSFCSFLFVWFVWCTRLLLPAPTASIAFLFVAVGDVWRVFVRIQYSVTGLKPVRLTSCRNVVTLYDYAGSWCVLRYSLIAMLPLAVVLSSRINVLMKSSMTLYSALNRQLPPDFYYSAFASILFSQCVS